MKKILILGAAAMAVALVQQQQASAWVNFKFGAGVNWNWQSGGNNFLWGLFRNGQPPGPDGHHQGYPGGGGFPGHFPPYGPQDFQYFGSQPAVPQFGGYPHGGYNPSAAMYHPATWYGNPAYQAASWGYPAQAYPYYGYPAYSYPYGYPAYGYPSYGYPAHDHSQQVAYGQYPMYGR